MNTEKKNQHYIPKFYLRNFSYKQNNKQIGVFNINNRKFIQRGKLKTQGSKNFFYGTDGKIEDGLSEIEGRLAQTIRNILTEKSPPQLYSKEHIELLTFVGLTHLRNPVIIENIKKSTINKQQKILELDPNIDVEELLPTISHEEAIYLALSNIPSVIDNTEDLSYKLVINKTHRPFISSDFPVVKYNLFLERRKSISGKTGYGSLGLKIFIPLNPKISILFYDPQIYKIGNRKDNFLELKNEKDINQLNILQFLNCYGTIFFNEATSEGYIHKLYSLSTKYKRANQPFTELHYMKRKGSQHKLLNPNKKKNLLISGTTDCEINLNIEGLKLTKKSTKVKLDQSVAQLRALPKKRMQHSR